MHYFLSERTEHNVTITQFAVDLSTPYNFTSVKICQVVVRQVPKRLVIIASKINTVATRLSVGGGGRELWRPNPEKVAQCAAARLLLVLQAGRCTGVRHILRCCSSIAHAPHGEVSGVRHTVRCCSSIARAPSGEVYGGEAHLALLLVYCSCSTRGGVWGEAHSTLLLVYCSCSTRGGVRG